MRYQGRITNWNDERGFGFVLPDGEGERVFLHINAFERRHRRPAGDERVTYELRYDERNRPQAAAVRYADVPVTTASSATGTLPAALFSLGFVGFAAVMAFLNRVPAWVPLVYIGVSIIAFFTYAADKEKANRGEWRTSESTLHLLELAGGWPGALIAQQALRHKNRKEPFLLVFWGIVALHIALCVWILTLNPFGAFL